MDSTLFFNPFQVVYVNFATKNLLVCCYSTSSAVETISMIFPYFVNFYFQIQNPISLISMSTTYLESFGADLSKNKLFQCVSILLTGMSTVNNGLTNLLAMFCTFFESESVLQTLKVVHNIFGHNHHHLYFINVSPFTTFLYLEVHSQL